MYRLLIVDCRQDTCEKIRQMFNWSRYGFSGIAFATSYTDAISKAVDLQPHIALVNIKLENHWGYDLVAHFRSIGMKTIFCILSDYDDPQYMRKAMQAGARDYLQKPLNKQELQSFVERTILLELKGTLPVTADLQDKIDLVLHMEYAKFSGITNKIILFVRSNYQYPQTLSSIAKLFNMNSKYIGRIFLKDTGIKFTEYLTAYRMLEARRLLIMNTHEKISAIAAMVGYSQLNNFYVHFKNYFGYSPGTLRSYDIPSE